MSADASSVADPPIEDGKQCQIASWWHLLGFLVIMAGTAGLGFYAQAGAGSASSAPAQDLADHSKAPYAYLVACLMDWALLYYCWVGVHRYGGTLRTFSGGRWTSWRDVAADVGVALPFWALWEGTAYAVHWMLGASAAKSVASLLPRSRLEILLWIAVSVTAGICEEAAFRGYLQRQIHALTSSVGVAVIAQALVFGVAHSYQGWKSVIVIGVLGVLYGVLAGWRRNLGANMIAHAWSDIWEGWLKAAI